MELHSHVTQVRSQLEAAAALGDERTREIARSLAAAVEPAVQLALVGALSEAADEITAALLDSTESPTVSVRLDGDGARFTVTASAPAEPVVAAASDDPDTSARISLRLSEALKSDIEAAARRDGISVNTWLVRTASAVLSSGGRYSGRTTGGAAQRVTGWING